jgi:cyanate permease
LTDLGYDRMQAASVLSFMLAGSACARFPIGWLGDRLEPRLLLFGLLVAAAIALGLVWQAPGLGWLLLAGVLFGAAYGGTLVLIPAVIANYFGAASFASINGFVFPVQLVIASVVPVGAGYLADLTGSYDVSFIGLTAFTILAAACALTTQPPTRQART